MTIGKLSDIAVELGLNLDKTFKEYSAQRYRLDTNPSSGQAPTDPEFPIASIK